LKVKFKQPVVDVLEFLKLARQCPVISLFLMGPACRTTRLFSASLPV
jgi:hypothetical protein